MSATPRTDAAQWTTATGEKVVFASSYKLLELENTKLLEVAIAAKEYAGSVSSCCMTGDCTGEVCELHCALKSLEESGVKI